MNEMDEKFRREWNTTGKKFTPTHCEWLTWVGQPMLYDGELCVNRTPEEHMESQQRRGSLLL